MLRMIAAAGLVLGAVPGSAGVPAIAIATVPGSTMAPSAAPHAMAELRQQNAALRDRMARLQLDLLVADVMDGSGRADARLDVPRHRGIAPVREMALRR